MTKAELCPLVGGVSLGYRFIDNVCRSKSSFSQIDPHCIHHVSDDRHGAWRLALARCRRANTVGRSAQGELGVVHWAKVLN